jgi:hypothetical protein
MKDYRGSRKLSLEEVVERQFGGPLGNNILSSSASVRSAARRKSQVSRHGYVKTSGKYVRTYVENLGNTAEIPRKQTSTIEVDGCAIPAPNILRLRSRHEFSETERAKNASQANATCESRDSAMVTRWISVPLLYKICSGYSRAVPCANVANIIEFFISGAERLHFLSEISKFFQLNTRNEKFATNCSTENVKCAKVTREWCNCTCL